MLRQSMLRFRWIGVLLLVALFSALGIGSAAWAVPVAVPQRQTVPLTPPPTWTRIRPSATRTPLPTRPESQSTTPVPQSTPGTQSTSGSPVTPAAQNTSAPQRTVVSSDTPLSGSSALPTSSSVAAVTPAAPSGPWLNLSAAPLIVGPNSRVALRVELRNGSADVLSNATLLLSRPATLSFAEAHVTSGQVELKQDALVWTCGSLAGGAVGSLELEATVAPDVLPDGTIPLHATLSWAGGELFANQVTLTLPWALLPDVGE
jgi:hypothetical protein